MIRIVHNDRVLAIRFCYGSTYAIDVPRKSLTEAEKLKLTYEVRNGDSKFVRIVRPKTECMITEGTGAAAKIIGQHEVKLHYKDQRFQKGTEAREKFLKLLVKYAMKNAGANLSHGDRAALWHAFLTKNTKRPNPVPRDGDDNPPTTPAAPAAVGMRSTVSTEDTVPVERRIARHPNGRGPVPETAKEAPSTPSSPDGHRVVNNVVMFPAGRWQGNLLAVLPGETVH